MAVGHLIMEIGEYGYRKLGGSKDNVPFGDD